MMKRFIPIVASATALAFALGALPATAQYATEFSQAKLLKQGTTTADIAGTGTVVVQVQVNADGTHKVIKIIKSTNTGDNDAATEIAQNSTYRPAHKGYTPVTAYYDFTLKFAGKTVSQSSDAIDSGADNIATGAAGQVAAALKAQQYAQAKQLATAALAAAPTDTLRQLLGVADAQLGDFEGATTAFDSVAKIGKPFVLVAAQSYAHEAVSLSQSDPAKALAYGQKAVALDSGTNSKYALGVAQVANKQYADAITTLRAVHASLFADATAQTQAKVAVDASLLVAYQQTDDNADAQAMAAEVKQIDPTSTLPGRIEGNALLASAIAALNAKDYVTAQKDFDAAAAAGDPDVAVTAYNQSALLIMKGQKPNYKDVQTYAEKALALKPNDAMANFIEGIALTAEWDAVKGVDAGSTTTTSGTLHTAARDQVAVLPSPTNAGKALKKADELAKAAGNQQLALQIEDFMKKNPLIGDDSGSTYGTGVDQNDQPH
jgi:tetratricopeptide (TPR) repeat protein